MCQNRVQALGLLEPVVGPCSPLPHTQVACYTPTTTTTTTTTHPPPNTHTNTHTHTQVVPLDCGVDEAPAARAALLHYYGEQERRTSTAIAHLNQTVEGGKYWAGPCTTFVDGSTLCGCRVAECALGSLYADAFRHLGNADIGVINGGSFVRPTTTPPLHTPSHAHAQVRAPAAGSAARVRLLNADLVLPSCSTSNARGLVFIWGCGETICGPSRT